MPYAGLLDEVLVRYETPRVAAHTGDEHLLVVERDEEARTGLLKLLRDDGLGVRSARTAEAALESALATPPRLVLAEINLEGMCGYELLRRLRSAFGDSLPVVFVSGERTEPFDRVAGMLLGADDYITKPYAPDELLARVRRLLRATGPASSYRTAVLTAREREVLALLAGGQSQREIARTLTIAPKTCGKHIERILEKLQVHSRAQAVAVAYRDDLLAARR
jgi:DNA-binding NarL/FixJ family response regulator